MIDRYTTHPKHFFFNLTENLAPFIAQLLTLCPSSSLLYLLTERLEHGSTVQEYSLSQWRPAV